MEKDMHKRNKEKDSSEGSGSEPDEEYSSADASSVSDDLLGSKSGKKDEKKKKEKVAKDKTEKTPKKKKEGKKDRSKGDKEKKKDPNAPKRNQV
jgi:structure-specific recognition protein 1